MTRMGKVICVLSYSTVSSFLLRFSDESWGSFFSFVVDFDHFQILRAIGKGAFGKVGYFLSGQFWSLNVRFDWFPCFSFSGLHRSKERHQGYVCNEIHEQECLHKEGCREKRASGIGNSEIPGAPISCQFVVRFSRRGRYVYGGRPSPRWWHSLPFAASNEIRRTKGEIIFMWAGVGTWLFAEQESYTQVI